jgi:phosphoribosylformimino-5-aminoimidazole carboxamide ribotide isomerase
MQPFTVFPAIDLRQGRVVRLRQGDPAKQTVYSDDPATTARRWLEAGTGWLHVVNLDGAFGDKDSVNRAALIDILGVAAEMDAQIQFGGGIRSLEAVETALQMGVGRVVLGTLAVEQPDVLTQALAQFGSQHIAVGIDAKDGKVRIHGWTKEASLTALDLAQDMRRRGLEWCIFTDIGRDGVSSGVNVTASAKLADTTGLHVIASGGIRNSEDIFQVRQAKLSGVIIGKALYDGKIDLRKITH